MSTLCHNSEQICVIGSKAANEPSAVAIGILKRMIIDEASAASCPLIREGSCHLDGMPAGYVNFRTPVPRCRLDLLANIVLCSSHHAARPHWHTWCAVTSFTQPLLFVNFINFDIFCFSPNVFVLYGVTILVSVGNYKINELGMIVRQGLCNLISYLGTKI